jgi:DNA-binding transcriptional ArsR family regulator
MLNKDPSPVNVFRALADPTRMVIVERLMRGEATVSELAQPLDMSLAAVVQQIKVLEEYGVIHTRKEGRVRICGIERKALSMAEEWMAKRRNMWERHLDDLGDLLNEQKPNQKKRGKHEV